MKEKLKGLRKLVDKLAKEDGVEELTYLCGYGLQTLATSFGVPIQPEIDKLTEIVDEFEFKYIRR